MLENSIAEDFKQLYGEKALIELLKRSGKHSKRVGSLAVGAPITLTDDHVLVFALLEILDYKCCEEMCYTTLTAEEIKAFLVKHKARVLEMLTKQEIEPPSYLGLLFGVYDFLSG